MAKPGVEPAFTKQDIVDAAFNLIDAQGETAFSMRKLADKLGMSPMGLYSYFPSKAAIEIAVVEKMYSDVDNKPVPGEYWEDTMKRICNSLRDVSLQHPQVRILSSQINRFYSSNHNKNIYYVHCDQGMPKDVYRILYDVFAAFLSGFITNECYEILDHHIKHQSADGKSTAWSVLKDSAYSSDSFQTGVQILLDGIKVYAAPDPCDWRTPEDTSKWTFPE